MENKTKVTAVGVVAGGILAIILALGISTLAHEAHLNAESASIATQLGNQGITDLGHVDAASMTVSLKVGTCNVYFDIQQGKTYTLFIPYYDARGRLIRHTSTIQTSDNEAAVLASMQKLVSPTSAVCK
jgi:hypothetical protein